jgi:hypothetical protein
MATGSGAESAGRSGFIDAVPAIVRKIRMPLLNFWLHVPLRRVV